LTNYKPSPFEDAISVIRTLRDAGHIAYLAGGCVRDRLLGIEPKDYDVATDAPPARVQSLFRRTQAVGAAFGVILVLAGRSKIEVATFRADGNYADGRHPESVRFTSAEEDAQRRDFTINGLFFDPLADDGRGRVIDYVGGQADLAARRLRAIGDPLQRFSEDHLRMLRAVRFAARFGFEVEERTAAAIRADASKIAAIAAERIADELRRMLTAPTRAAAVELLLSLGLASVILFPLPLREGVGGGVQGGHRFTTSDRSSGPLPPTPSRKGRGGRLVDHLAGDQVLSVGLSLLAAIIDVRIELAGGQHDRLSNFAPAEVKKLVAFARQRLKLSNEELGEMEGIATSLHALLTTREPTVAQLKRFLAKSYATNARLLLAAVRQTGEAAGRIATLEARLATFDGTEVAPQPLLKGDDLIAAGAQPGPQFKKALDAVYDAQLEGRITDRDTALRTGLELLASAH